MMGVVHEWIVQCMCDHRQQGHSTTILWQPRLNLHKIISRVVSNIKDWGRKSFTSQHGSS